MAKVKAKQKVKRKSEDRDPAAILLQELKETVRLANTMFARRDPAAIRCNKFEHKHKWSVKNPHKKKLDEIADKLSQYMERIRELEQELGESEDYELYLPMINNIFSNYLPLKQQRDVNKDSLQHGTKGRKINLARVKGRARRVTGRRG